MVQQVKHLALTLQWLGLVLWHAFDRWPGNFDMLWVEEKHLTFKKKKKKKRHKSGREQIILWQQICTWSSVLMEYKQCTWVTLEPESQRPAGP